MATVFLRLNLFFNFSLLPPIPHKSSGLASYTNTRTHAVIIPSTSPIARCIGCITETNAPNESFVIPDASVSSVTENAPSCNVITQPSIEAIVIFFFETPFFIINFHIRIEPIKHP